MDALNELKRCPVCKANVFSDMDICYNCMYRFGSNLEIERSAMSAKDVYAGEEVLLSQFLVEFERFLSNFLLDRLVDVK